MFSTITREYLEGESLAGRLAKGPLPSDQARQTAIEIAEALDKAHGQGIVHRDLKPGSIRHPKRENVTVLSGTLKVGMGDQFDESKMMTFPADSFAYLDPRMHHYAASSGRTMIQIHGPSPLQFNYVNPNDDPSKKK